MPSFFLIIYARVARGLIKLLAFVKIRTYSKNAEELWLEEWRNPLHVQVSIEDPDTFKTVLREQFEGTGNKS